MRSLTPQTAVKFTTLGDMVAASIDTARFRTWLFGAFAVLALLLAMAGVYGVMAYLTAQRTAEFGLRVALGASRRDLFGDVLARAGILGGAGLAVGLLGALAFSRLLSGMLYGLTPGDVPTYLGVAAMVEIVVAVAAAVPAWRAAHIDPISALRQE
jgi:ABC-type antimicrobial peptide transport system permease subunit